MQSAIIKHNYDELVICQQAIAKRAVGVYTEGEFGI